jgi:hypothetical protein
MTIAKPRAAISSDANGGIFSPLDAVEQQRDTSQLGPRNHHVAALLRQSLIFDVNGSHTCSQRTTLI